MKGLIFFFLIFYGFKTNGQITALGDSIAILAFDSNWRYTPLPSYSRPDTLAETDYLIIDSLLSCCIAAYNQSQEEWYNEVSLNDHPSQKTSIKPSVQYFLIDLKKYNRQYVVVKNMLGQKEIWINCFCSKERFPDWRSHIVSVRGGGKCFFNLRINLASNIYYYFRTNAPE